MKREDLVSGRERLALLDVLAGNGRELDADPERFLEIAPAKLLPFLFLRLRETPLPQAVRETLAAAYRRNVLAELRRAAELRRIRAALDEHAIRFLVLKGPVLASTVYPERGARTMTDLDFLIEEEQHANAVAALEGAGYRVPAAFAGRQFFAGDSAPLIHEQPGGPSIELHTMLDSLPNERNALAATWPAARTVDAGHGLALRTLARDEFFAHVVTHLSRHHRFEGELRSLLDVALLLHHDDLPWEVLLPQWDERGIGEWIVLTVRLAHLLLRAPLPAPLAQRPVREEALTLAAEQLWVAKNADVPAQLLFALGGSLTPVHHAVSGTKSAMPRGVAGARVRVSRGVERFRRLASAAARPGAVLAAAGLHRRRERLFALVEKSPHR